MIQCLRNISTGCQRVGIDDKPDTTWAVKIALLQLHIDPIRKQVRYLIITVVLDLILLPQVDFLLLVQIIYDPLNGTVPHIPQVELYRVNAALCHDHVLHPLLFPVTLTGTATPTGRSIPFPQIA